MSRLDSFLRRVAAQRDCLNMAAGLVGGLQGPVLDLGLGNGRTFDHLRDLFPQREIFVFDRQVAAHPDCIPDDEHMILGEIRDTLPVAMERIGAPAVLAHSDVGTGDAASNAVLAAFVGPALGRLMQPGGIIVSDQPMTAAGWTPMDLPPGVADGRYFMWRAGG